MLNTVGDEYSEDQFDRSASSKKTEYRKKGILVSETFYAADEKTPTFTIMYGADGKTPALITVFDVDGKMLKSVTKFNTNGKTPSKKLCTERMVPLQQ